MVRQGSKVVCIENIPLGKFGLVVGKVYTVANVWGVNGSHYTTVEQIDAEEHPFFYETTFFMEYDDYHNKEVEVVESIDLSNDKIIVL